MTSDLTWSSETKVQTKEISAPLFCKVRSFFADNTWRFLYGEYNSLNTNKQPEN